MPEAHAVPTQVPAWSSRPAYLIECEVALRRTMSGPECLVTGLKALPFAAPDVKKAGQTLCQVEWISNFRLASDIPWEAYAAAYVIAREIDGDTTYFLVAYELNVPLSDALLLNPHPYHEVF